METREEGVKVVVIAVEGGPCAGKSTSMAKAKQYLESHGYKVAVLSEVATEFILAGLPPWERWEDPLDFQRALLSYSFSRQAMYVSMLRKVANGKPCVLLCDRGLRGFRAYVSSEDALRLLDELGFSDQMLNDFYAAVIHLVTAADGAEEFFTLENNQARTESLEEARALDMRTRTAWHGHPHHLIIDNRTGFEQKVQRALTAFARVIGMPEPLEKERKFLVTNFSEDLIPKECVKVLIDQTYLISPSPYIERRIRRWTVGHTSSYFYTEKKPTEEIGVRIEKERQISLREYELLMEEKDPKTRTIHKIRHCFSEHGHNFELDVYEGIPHVTIEVEVDDMNLEIKPPTGFKGVEITGDKKYSNREFARIDG